MNKDKYKVEKLEYKYEWLDVGPGPSERGNVTGIMNQTQYKNTSQH
jgi:hypothetical protein